MKTDKKGTCVYEKDIHISNKGQGAATNREKGQGITWTRVGAAPCKNGLARTLLLTYLLTKIPSRDDGQCFVINTSDIEF